MTTEGFKPPTAGAEIQCSIQLSYVADRAVSSTIANVGHTVQLRATFDEYLYPMTQTFQIKGMTCNGCRSSIEKTLSDLPQVSGVMVHLEEERAVIESEHVLSAADLQNVLPDKYSVSSPKNPMATTTDVFESVQEPSKLSQLKPLFLILGYVAVGSLIINRNDLTAQDYMLDYMGLFYIVFGFFKFLDLRGFVSSFAMYDPLAGRIGAYGWIYPFIETSLGLLLLLRVQVPAALVATLIILGITTVGVVNTLSRKREIQCACLGSVLKLPMTQATLIENAIMIVMALMLLLQ